MSAPAGAAARRSLVPPPPPPPPAAAPGAGGCPRTNCCPRASARRFLALQSWSTLYSLLITLFSVRSSC